MGACRLSRDRGNEGLNLPVDSISDKEAGDYFGFLATLAMTDLAASSTLKRSQLDWNPVGPSLLHDLRQMDYRTAQPGE